MPSGNELEQEADIQMVETFTAMPALSDAYRKLPQETQTLFRIVYASAYATGKTEGMRDAIEAMGKPKAGTDGP